MDKIKEMNYGEMVKALAKPGHDIAENITGGEAHLIHMAVGVCGEAGELLDAIKKHVIYKKPLDLANVVEELGDLEFYLEGLRSALEINRLEVFKVNMEKLSKRYESGRYSNEQAQVRADKEGRGV